MAFYTPTQSRAVDPYSSYDSDNVNRLTRVVSKGDDVISQGMETSLTDSTSVTVATGVVVKDDVMINFQQEAVIDFTDGDWFIEGTAAPVDATTYYYVVVDYQYAKSSPAPTADIKILKTRANYGSSYLFLKCVYVEDGQPTLLYDYDPEDPSVCVSASSVQVQFVDTLPPWNSSYRGIVFIVDNGRYLAVGGETDWYYFATDSTSTSYAIVYQDSSLPAWAATDVGKIYVIGDEAWIGTSTQWTSLTSGVCDTISGISNPDGNIELYAGDNIDITPSSPDSTSITIAVSMKSGTGAFTGNGSTTTVAHGLGANPTAVHVTAAAGASGNLGEVWATKDSTNIYVGNTGSFTGNFYWTAIIQ